MRKNILVYAKLAAALQQKLEQHFNLIIVDGINQQTLPTIKEKLPTIHGLLGSSHPINADFLVQAKQLEAVSTISVGIDYFDLDYLNQHNIPLMHTPGVLTDATADTAFMLIMCTARRCVELANYIYQGKWQKSITKDLYGVNVAGKTLGIAGMGRIGYAIAKRAHLGFDMPIQYYNRSANPKAEQHLNAKKVDFDTLLSTSDFVCSVLPATNETAKIFDANAFAKMRPSTIFVNIGRGAVVDEEALINALRNKQIHAAGLDVFAKEPLAGDSALLKLDNVVMLPHIGSATVETRYAMAVCAVDNLINALQGDISTNCANREQIHNNKLT